MADYSKNEKEREPVDKETDALLKIARERENKKIFWLTRS